MNSAFSRLHFRCDGTRAETRFRLSRKRTCPFKSAGGASVQSTAGSRDVCISSSNAGYITFRGGVYWLSTPFVSLPFTSPTVRHRMTSCFTCLRFNWTLRFSRCVVHVLKFVVLMNNEFNMFRASARCPRVKSAGKRVGRTVILSIYNNASVKHKRTLLYLLLY